MTQRLCLLSLYSIQWKTWSKVAERRGHYRANWKSISTNTTTFRNLSRDNEYPQ
jgi:hypothetical protein